MKLPHVFFAVILVGTTSCAPTAEQGYTEEQTKQTDQLSEPQNEVDLSHLPLEAFIPSRLPGFTNRFGYEATADELVVWGAQRGLLYDWEADQTTRDAIYHDIFLSVWRYASNEDAAQYLSTDLPRRAGEIQFDTVADLPVSLVLYSTEREARVEVILQKSALVLEVSNEIGMSRGSPSFENVLEQAKEAFSHIIGHAREAN